MLRSVGGPVPTLQGMAGLSLMRTPPAVLNVSSGQMRATSCCIGDSPTAYHGKEQLPFP